MIAIKDMTMEKDSEGCLNCAFHWNGDSTTYCLAQSHPYKPGEERLHKINYDEEGNKYGADGPESCYTWRESTCPLVEVDEGMIAIEIPKEEYKKILNMYPAYPDDVFCLTKAIQNGIALPAGHGRLIDADALEKEIHCTTDYNGDKHYWIAKESLDNAQTMVEADKRGQDDSDT